MFDSPLSSTRGLPEIWERCVVENDLFFAAEAARSYHYPHNVVDHSKYSFVNKTRTVARGICTEPSVNMWLQLGAGAILEDRLKSFFRIDFNGDKDRKIPSQPELNAELARVGSITDRLATIDLESASDSMALGMLAEMLPRSFLSVLLFLRCPKTRTPSGEELALNMVSTMGNGFTFPLQTMLFAAVVRGVASVVGCKLDHSNFGVFGDDIICPSQMYRTVTRVLSILGFTVNASKSFVEGPFRESCGADFFLGQNIRGVYLKKLRSKQDFNVAINTLNRWSAKTGVFLSQTVHYLMEYTRFWPVPLDESDDAGIQTPLCFATKCRPSRGGNVYYKASVPRDWCFYILGDMVWTFREQVRRRYNPAGLYISLLYGGIRGSRITLRQRNLRYGMKLKKSPRWDFLPSRPIEGLVGLSGFRRLVDAWYYNLFDYSTFGSPR
jgi:hypothetical protein